MAWHAATTKQTDLVMIPLRMAAVQPVEATSACGGDASSSLSASAGVFQSRVLRGLLRSLLATGILSTWERVSLSAVSHGDLAAWGGEVVRSGWFVALP